MNIAPPMRGVSVAKPIILMQNTNEKGGKCTRILKNYLRLITWKYLNISFVQQIIGSFPYFPNVSIRNLCATAHARVHFVTPWSPSWKCLLCSADTPLILPHFTITFSVSFLQLLVNTPSGLPRISHVPWSISARFQINFSSIPGRFHQVAISWSISSGGTFEITSTRTPRGEVELPERTLYKQWGWGVKYHLIRAVRTGTLLTGSE